MAVKKTEVKTTSVAEAKKVTETPVADKAVTETPKSTVKETAPKAAVKKAEPKKTVAKTAAKKTTTTRSSAAKEEIFLQFAGKELSTKDMVKRAKEIWTKEMGQKVSALKDLKLYLKPEESAVYYVMNGDVTGKIQL